jgi:hypothetical protein
MAPLSVPPLSTMALSMVVVSMVVVSMGPTGDQPAAAWSDRRSGNGSRPYRSTTGSRHVRLDHRTIPLPAHSRDRA